VSGEVRRPVAGGRSIRRRMVMTRHRDVRRDCESCRQWRPKCSVRPRA
jgi:hypothetical protein